MCAVLQVIEPQLQVSRAADVENFCAASVLLYYWDFICVCVCYKYVQSIISKLETKSVSTATKSLSAMQCACSLSGRRI